MNKSIFDRIFHLRYLFLGVFAGLMVSCSPTRHLTEDVLLYNKAKIQVDDKKFETLQLEKYQRIAPNKRIAGVRFHLFLYNLGNPNKEKFPHGWFRKIGEAPIIYDSLLVNQNKINFNKYLFDIGYNHVEVNCETESKGAKKVNARYIIKLGEPTRIGKFEYFFEDTSIQRFIIADSSTALIKQGVLFSKPAMELERQRIDNLLKNKGFYKFSKEYIFYEVRLTENPYLVDVTLTIKQSISGPPDPITKIRKHRRYYIENVVFVPNQLDPSKTYVDTLFIDNYKFLKTEGITISPQTLISANRIEPGSLYVTENVNKTYSNLTNLGLFRFINIQFSDAVPSEETENLNCKIELAMRKRQAYSTELVMTNSGGDFGARGSITYNNYNTFRGGEHFQVGISGALESLKQRLDNPDLMRELGVSSRFETPKFLLPFSTPEFQRKYSPRTAFELSYNYQNQPRYYVRTIANTSISYIWKGNMFNKHSIYPIDFYLVKLPQDIDSTYYANNIKGTRLENSFENHTILATKYAFEFSTQQKGFTRDYIYFHSNIESAGFLLNAVKQLSELGSDTMFFKVKYAQYLRSDIDLRHFKVINKANKIVYRFYAGMGVPYGNSTGMPFEKMFWSGGPYGIRAWSERSLGPGSYPDSTFNQLGDIKLEGNFEYRFKLFWVMEGALFADAGNVWLQKEDPVKPGAEFHLSTFYKDLAIGTGFGFRFDFTFILLRTDFGFKVRDPAIQSDASIPYPGEKPYYDTGSKWTFMNPSTNFRNMTFQFGIGYPF